MLRDVISGGVLLILSVGYYLTATGFQKSALDTSVSASAFPEMIGIIGALFSLLLIAQALWRLSSQRTAAAVPAVDAEDDPMDDWPTHRKAFGLLVIIALFTVALATLGYPVAIAGLILAVATYQGIPMSWKTVATAIIGALLFWLFFVQLLGIHMPLGFWHRLSALDLSPLSLFSSVALA